MPIAIPKPIASAPIGPSAKRGAIGRTTPPPVKNTSDAANTAANAPPSRRGGASTEVVTA